MTNKLSYGYNNKLLYSIHLQGNPTAPTPKPTKKLNNLEIVNVQFLKQQLPSEYIHINALTYYIIGPQYNIIADIQSVIYLPVSNKEATVIHILNNSGELITVNSQNDELIYSTMYIQSNGATSFYLEPFQCAKFINIFNNGTYSWILSLN